MIVHRRKVDVGGGDDVAQRDVGETAIRVKPFGGAHDRGSCMVGRHVMPAMRPQRKAGSCNSNSCMKLWFEGWNVNAKHALPCRPERFQAKACPALDAGWIPVRVKETRQIRYRAAVRTVALCPALPHRRAERRDK